MRLRRRPRPERVRQTLADTVTTSWGEEIIRLRKVMQAAVSELYADRPDDARRMLSAALAERWWR